MAWPANLSPAATQYNLLFNRCEVFKLSASLAVDNINGNTSDSLCNRIASPNANDLVIATTAHIVEFEGARAKNAAESGRAWVGELGVYIDRRKYSDVTIYVMNDKHSKTQFCVVDDESCKSDRERSSESSWWSTATYILSWVLCKFPKSEYEMR